MLFQHSTVNCKGRILSLKDPIVMGILNITPDSFYDGGMHMTIANQIEQAEKMVEHGAQIIDIGGMSSRPGADIIGVDEELKRVLPVIEAISNKLPEVFLSIDTVHSKVAKQSIEAGAHIVNDISAGSMDEAMYETVAELGVPYILMHMKGSPKFMQSAPKYESVVLEVLDFFIKEFGKLRALGIKDLIVDPGFGFGKSVDHNYQLLKNIHAFKMLETPILVGLSRKSMICKLLKINPDKALNGTTALHMIALQQGAKILRVHDVKEAVECIELFTKIEEIE